MRRFLLIPLLLITLGAFGGSNHPNLLDSVAPLSWTTTNPYTGETGLGIHCTAWSLNEKKGYWVTAGHCVAGGEDEDQIDLTRDYHLSLTQTATPFVADFALDVAILKSDAIAPALPISKDEPTWNDAVDSAGFPLGFPGVLVFHGQMIGSEPSEAFGDDPGGKFLIFSLPGAPGNSGSPILHKGKVISLWTRGITPFGSFAGGLETSKLYAFLAPYTS